MTEWVTVQKAYKSEEAAAKAAQIIEITEGRLNSSAKGAQYTIETKIFAGDEGWRIAWRKVFAGFSSGCGSGCNSCGPQAGQCESDAGQQSIEGKNPTSGKVIPFRKRR